MKITVLTGGVGGAKLVRGLLQTVPAADVTAIVNTGDDFRHFGLHVSPDIDTLLYTLSGRANQAQGWGRADESWAFMAALRELGGEDWFQLGDGDLALHVLRSARLANGQPLHAITADFARAWDIAATVLPMTNDCVATQIDTPEGTLDFQRYFVALRCAPVARAVRFSGAGDARPAPGVLDALSASDAILLAPSNPFLSIDPILAVPAIGHAVRNAAAPVVAVSPIIGGNAVKGPTAKLMREQGLALENRAIAAHYANYIDGLLIHAGDDAPEQVTTASTDILMRDDGDKARVAAAALALARTIGAG